MLAKDFVQALIFERNPCWISFWMCYPFKKTHPDVFFEDFQNSLFLLSPMIDGMSYGVPVLKFIIDKVVFSAIYDLRFSWKPYSLSLHEHFVKTVGHQNKFGWWLRLWYLESILEQYLESRNLYFLYQSCLLCVSF